MNAPEGFVPFEFDTGMGKIMLPDRRCVMCIAMGQYMQCTACTYQECIKAHAAVEAQKYMDEMNRLINESMVIK